MASVQRSGLCDYFSNFELAELMAMFNFFERIFGEACDDCQINGEEDFRM